MFDSQTVALASYTFLQSLLLLLHQIGVATEDKAKEVIDSYPLNIETRQFDHPVAVPQ
jgi:hypothetical protein